ncbi:hypothetical protein VSR01_10620 [Actinacidiphila sp. DG2A-62]|uniref:hypothetical protein n=1 Tax=Actinacidiphila sp. DG2A-62 TaxID=3108821 RepID=UPI002DBC86B8|nr:hypothetical protein [Actinacidiphila sp. DG2A-62]MEC3993971.1 hypothetical protein [Actinacidiphila sp. DG2A-62]
MPDLTDAELDQLIDAIGLKRPRGGSKRKPIAHGELRGARQHRYRKEPLCEACRRAENEYQRNKPKSPRKASSQQYLTEEEWQARVAARKAAKAGGEQQ